MAAAEQSLGAWVGRLAHDLRNPLAALLFNLRFLRETTSVGGETREAVNESLIAAERLERMIADAQDLCELQADRLRAASAPVRLSELEPDLRARLAFVGTPGALEVRLPDIEVRTDRGLLLRALTNLGEHALRQTPAGTPVIVDAERGRGVTLRVSDGGPPFGERPSFLDEELSPKRVPAAGQRSDQGLGLHLAGRLARALGATTDVQPRPGCGQVFSLFFPEEALP